MKFKITKEQFLNGLQAVQSVVSGRHTLPVLSHLLLRAEPDRVELTATDLDVTIARSVPAEVAAAGALTLPAKRIWSIVRELPPGDIEMAADAGNVCSLRAGSSFYKIHGLAAEEYPATPAVKSPALTLPMEKLAALLRLVAPAMSTEESRPLLNGVFMSLSASRVVLVATDGRRLAKVDDASAEDTASTPPAAEFILPSKAAQELGRLSVGAGVAEARCSENHAAFTLTEEGGLPVSIITKLIEGRYPNYRQVIPTEVRERVRLPREEWLHALRRASLMTSEKAQSVRLTFMPGQLSITTNAPEVGEAVEKLAIPYQGKELAIAFNPDYLLAALKGLEEDEVQLDLIDELSPAVIRSGAGYLHVIMPIRLT